jgi:DNA mismatch endonuclease (patch repair protein)
MTDIVDSSTRSRMMSGIRGRNTKPELKVRRYLHGRGFRYRLHVRSLPGTPDLTLPRYHTVVLVHGCFWHSHDGCTYAYKPQSNADFWRRKLDRNVDRDGEVERALAMGGWRVLTVWECETSERQLAQLADVIRGGPTPQERAHDSASGGYCE